MITKIILIFSLGLALIFPIILYSQQVEATHITRSYSAGESIMNGPFSCTTYEVGATSAQDRRLRWNEILTSGSGTYPNNFYKLLIDYNGHYVIWGGPNIQSGYKLAEGWIVGYETPTPGTFRLAAEETYGRSPVYASPRLSCDYTRTTPVPAVITGRCDAEADIGYQSHESWDMRFIGIVKCIPGEHEPPPIEGTVELSPAPGLFNSTTPQPVK